MKKKFLLMVGSVLTATTTAMAGGILTNTNQSVDFLRNPARDGAIGLDGVYTNPAGVAFLDEGFHLAFNWQYAHQTRTIESTNPLFTLGRKNNGSATKTFEGVADAPIIPSLQGAYNTGNWSIQFNFSVPGGGGKCEFDNGLGSFESVVGNIGSQLQPLGVTGYDMNGYMQGKQYYFGFQLGAAYKVTDNLSVYGGLRVLYGTASYKAKISDIMVKTGENYVEFGAFLQGTTAYLDGSLIEVNAGIEQVNAGLEQVNAGIAQYQSAGAEVPAELSAKQTELTAKQTELATTKATIEGTLQKFGALEKYSQGVNLQCDQTGVGVAPVIGIDYKLEKFNFAAKYEFRTPMKMKNKSTVNEASEIPAVNKFRDGDKVDEDAPALLTVGAQWSILDNLRLNLGYHHFFDQNVKWYNNSQDLLDGNTNEYLGGLEWDINDKLTASAGLQLTRYPLTDEYMNDMSFVVDSYSFGFGVAYKVTDNMKLTAAYFQTNYEDYEKVTSVEPLISDKFTRTNRVLGLGIEVNF